MPKKKVDERIRTLIENGVKSKTRSFFVIVGDRGKDQAVNLHYLLSKAQVKARPNMLWCYNKDLGFSTHRTKRMQKIKKLQARGLFDADKEDPFELFVSSTQIRWCYYKETAKVLGNTYGMAVLQDFEAITPNILCRTIETVEGGGIVVLLLHTMSSLKQLYTLTMDVHDRFRTGAHADVVGRFNERFILSLANCPSCLVLDDELNVLPISRHAKSIVPLPGPSAAASFGASADGIAAVETIQTEADRELQKLKSSMTGTAMVGGLVNACATLDQAKAVLTFAEAISEKSLRSTVALTAGRGRGKSAALGLSIAAAVAYGYSNIFVTSPSPENLKTLFEFVFKGLEALAYKEHADYEAVASTNPEFNRAVVRVNVFKGHRQTIQYIAPEDAQRLGQCELLVVDEAAAIPLPLVKQLLGPYLVFLASTVNGYEGTGRSLSLKLIQQLRISNAANAAGAAAAGGGAGAMTTSGSGGAASGGGRTLREVLLSEPIRYASGDSIEAWLNDLLCLDATTPYRLAGRLPAPTECALYAVDRDALFSYHKVSEAFLHRMMSLYVSSHYKNSPNDLQLMSDAPAHKLFVLLGPQNSGGTDASGLPDILCVLQVCLEGEISKDSVRAALSRGNKGSGDLIPWTLAQQFQEDGFASLSGARVVRIATHPDATKMGYGTRALQLLSQYYSGKLVNLAAADDDEGEEGILDVDLGLHRKAPSAGAGGAPASEKKKKKDKEADDDGDEGAGDASLTTEKVKPRKELPPLLVPCTDIRRPARLHWLGVSYGLTLSLFNFWRRGGYLPVYLRQTANELTAEHTMIMLRELDTASLLRVHPITGATLARPKRGWTFPFVADFGRRYMSLLGYEFRSFDPTLALSVMDAACAGFGFGGSAAAIASAAEKESAADGSDAVIMPSTKPLSRDELRFLFTPHDLKRLEAYARSQVDYHLIVDLLPAIARLYFSGKILNGSGASGAGAGDEGGAGQGGIPRLQAGILLGMGLQNLPIESLSSHFDLADNQVLALFHKAVRKVSSALSSIEEKTVASEVDKEVDAANAKAAAALAASKAAVSVSKAPGSSSSAKASNAAAAVAAAVLAEEGDLKKYAVPTGVVAAAAAAASSSSKKDKKSEEPAKKKQRKEKDEEESSDSSSSSSSSGSDSSSSDSESDSSSDSDDDAPAVPEVVRLPKPAGAPLSGTKRSHGDIEGSSSSSKKSGGGFGGFAKDELYDERGLLSKKGKGGKEGGGGGSGSLKKAKSARS